MSKKLMLLATGVLAALAFAALPAVASAGEFTADCETGATCSGEVTGGATELRNDAGEGISCTSATGPIGVTSGSSTGSLTLTFKGCKENITIFHFSCNNTGTAGEITTGPMVTHLIYLEPSATTPGIKITLPSAGVTFNCAGFAKKTVTGKVIGHLEDPNCGTFQSTHSADFKEVEHAGVPTAGIQRWTQATTSGATTDLESNSDNGGVYTTSSQIGTGTIHWTNNKVKLTC